MWFWTPLPHGVAMSGPESPCAYLAVLSPSVCAIHNLSDADGIWQRVLAAAGCGVLSTRSFRTQSEAVCWLTGDVVPGAVDACARLDDHPLLTSTSWPSEGLLAVVSRASTSTFPLSKAGCVAALARLRDPQADTCVVRGFLRSGDAWMWLASEAGASLLDVVACTGPSSDSHSSAATPTATSGLTLLPDRGHHVLGDPREVSRSSARRGAPSRVTEVASSALTFDESHGDTLALLESAPSTGPQSGDESTWKQQTPGVQTVSRCTVNTIAERFRPAKKARVGGFCHPSTSGTTRGGVLRRPSDALHFSTLPASARASRGRGSREAGFDGSSFLEDLLLPGAAPFPPSVPAADPETAVPSTGIIGLLATEGKWALVAERIWALNKSIFISGGPGAGKSTLLRRLNAFLLTCFAGIGEVVVVAPTGTAAKTAGGVTYHSFFGFQRDYQPKNQDPVQEAAEMLATSRFGPVKKRLSRVRALLLDEVSLVPADKLSVMYQLIRQSRPYPAHPCLWFAFGDFLQLRPVHGEQAFMSPCWSEMFGDAVLELTGAFRQKDPLFIRAVDDARRGHCSQAVLDLVRGCWVEGRQYEEMKSSIFHLMPRHKDVLMHNRACLEMLSPGRRPASFEAVDTIAVDPDRDTSRPAPALDAVSDQTRAAALADCVAPPSVPHCLHARVMIVNNRRSAIGICHGSIGTIFSYDHDGTPVVRLDNYSLPHDADRGSWGLRDAGDTWMEVACPPAPFSARILAVPGVLAVRHQVPFVLGWASTIHMSQSLTISEAVLDLAECFEAGMVTTALSRVGERGCMHVKSFSASRLFADPDAVAKYRAWQRL